jgi:hypothetical protein
MKPPTGPLNTFRGLDGIFPAKGLSCLLCDELLGNMAGTARSFSSREGRLTIGRRLTTCPTFRRSRYQFPGLGTMRTSVLRPGRPIENRPQATSLPYISLHLAEIFKVVVHCGDATVRRRQDKFVK